MDHFHEGRKEGRRRRSVGGRDVNEEEVKMMT
jgi:hypothetical protein